MPPGLRFSCEIVLTPELAPEYGFPAIVYLTSLAEEKTMSRLTRRGFLKNTSTAGLACSASLLVGRSAFAAAKSAAGANSAVRIYADIRRTVAPLERNVFGSFLEHLGRAIHEGIYDPGSKLSDANGFRKDVLDEIKKLGVPIVRYPGG